MRVTPSAMTKRARTTKSPKPVDDEPRTDEEIQRFAEEIHERARREDDERVRRQLDVTYSFPPRGRAIRSWPRRCRAGATTSSARAPRPSCCRSARSPVTVRASCQSSIPSGSTSAWETSESIGVAASRCGSSAWWRPRTRSKAQRPVLPDWLSELSSDESPHRANRQRHHAVAPLRNVRRPFFTPGNMDTGD